MTKLKLINSTAYIASFTDFNHYLLSFLSNLSGHAIDLFIFFNNIQVSANTCDLVSIYNTFGKVTYDLITVSPVATRLRSVLLEDLEPDDDLYHVYKVFEFL